MVKILQQDFLRLIRRITIIFLILYFEDGYKDYVKIIKILRIPIYEC